MARKKQGVESTPDLGWNPQDVLNEAEKQTESLNKKAKLIYYNPSDLLNKNATYSMVFGERSNGKTYAFLKYILNDYIKHGYQGALIRRWKEDYRGKRGQQMFEALNPVITQLTKGQYTQTYYYSGKWFLATRDETTDSVVSASEPFCYGFALSDVEHDKSTSYPRVRTIFFDEFLTRQYYLPDEFVTFMNVISTIVRQRDDVRVIMAGNTVNQYCPYFTEMGLVHAKDMKKGSIDVYTYGDSKLKVAIEYADSISENGKPSDVYFAFNNPKLEMITGGAWELAMYPHLPLKYTHNQIQFIFFLEFNQQLLQCEVIQVHSGVFLYVHRKSTPLQDTNKDLVFTMEDDEKPMHIRNMLHSTLPITKKIAWFFKNSKVFYQDNEVGEVMRNYLVVCERDKTV